MSFFKLLFRAVIKQLDEISDSILGFISRLFFHIFGFNFEIPKIAGEITLFLLMLIFLIIFLFLSKTYFKTIIINIWNEFRNKKGMNESENELDSNIFLLLLFVIPIALIIIYMYKLFLT